MSTNRIIKFRAWCEGTHENLTFTNPQMEYGVVLSENGNYCSVEGGWDIHGEYPSVPVMQYTGLKDKNGKPIYESDIVKWDSKTREGEIVLAGVMGIVGWNENKAGWGVVPDQMKDAEVIGNIYENPELLEGKEQQK